MKPLFALSLFLNLGLLVAVGYLLARGPEVVTRKEQVVVTKTLNPNIELETRIIALEAELVQENAKVTDTTSAMNRSWRELPPIIIPQTPAELGAMDGRVFRILWDLRERFPEFPEPGSEDYEIFVNGLDAFFAQLTPLFVARQEMESGKLSAGDVDGYVEGYFETKLGLPAQWTTQVLEVVRRYRKDPEFLTYQNRILNRDPFSSLSENVELAEAAYLEISSLLSQGGVEYEDRLLVQLTRDSLFSTDQGDVRMYFTLFDDLMSTYQP
ncbi:hypothetical protein H5P28_03735 [Ruficoccus amylovorans]|uniref:Uncharacterized protein n=1 Tax=Ruficoccus amylovorans TaxID=1804625 RepID=A0A842HAK1_9BACT|nr:hypothetical protein [Ruficoccus amylovorans]MBC2593365.1 hypothetical protein [Ruficoccus amylovorans]